MMKVIRSKIFATLLLSSLEFIDSIVFSGHFSLNISWVDIRR